MQSENKEIKYPENLPLLEFVEKSGKTVTELSEAIGYSRKILSQTINGQYKGVKVVLALTKELNITAEQFPLIKTYQDASDNA